MLLRGENGSEFILKIVSYQFVNVVGDRFEDNWLMVRGEVLATTGTAWAFDDACLTVFDAIGLGKWLNVAASGNVATVDRDKDNEVVPDKWFIEPDIAFSVSRQDGHQLDLRVFFSLLALPPGEKEKGWGIWEYHVEIPMTHEELKRAANEWNNEVALFPERKATES